jgi:peroxiredoxin family protein
MSDEALSLVLFSGTDDKLQAAAVLTVGAAAMGRKVRILVPCQMTMDLLGLTKDDLIDGIEEPAGATTALLAAQDAITLFI